MAHYFHYVDYDCVIIHKPWDGITVGEDKLKAVHDTQQTTWEKERAIDDVRR